MASTKCQVCRRKVKNFNKIKVSGMIWHKKCCRCTICDLQLSAKTARESYGTVYCIKHLPNSRPEESQRTETRGHHIARNLAEEKELLCFHGEVSRDEAERRLSKNGDFLIRWSTAESTYIVSVRCPANVLHLRIPRNGREFTFQQKVIPTLTEWVKRHMDGKTPVSETDVFLKNPVNRTNNPARKSTPSDAVEAGHFGLLRSKSIHDESSWRDLRFLRVSYYDGICQIWTASICEVKADVIVNSVNLNTNLDGGALARAIGKAGGPEIQKELDAHRQKSPKPPTFGDVIVTRGYNLPCKFIFHTILSKWQDGQHVVQDLRQIVKKILQLADERKCTTLAIPPIGTGVLGYPKQIVAQVLYTEAADYLDGHPDSNIDRIIFVVNGEDDLLEIFKKLQEEEDDNETESFYDYLIPDPQEEAVGYYESLEFEFSKTTDQLSAMLSKLGTQDIQYPRYWTLTKVSEKPYDLVELDPSSVEYKGVVANIIASDGEKYEKFIAKIERVENGRSYQVYEYLKQLMIKVNSSDVMNERLLWHGTSASAKDNIIATGFNRNYAGANATSYGRGVYFAYDFSYSAKRIYSPPEREYGLKYIFQSKVLTGISCQGHNNLMEPEFLPDNTRQYDSAVDNLQNPKIFVVFKDYVAYPEYLISFYEDSSDYVNIRQLL